MSTKCSGKLFEFHRLGRQEERFFHGYYGDYCYLPLYIFCGDALVCARWRTSHHGAAAGCVEELERVVQQIRQAWPELKIILRGDSGFCGEELIWNIQSGPRRWQCCFLPSALWLLLRPNSRRRGLRGNGEPISADAVPFLDEQALVLKEGTDA